MPFIITATDFSDVSVKAVNYACMLANDTGASLAIIHTFIIPIAFSDTPIPATPLDEMQEDAEARMEELVKKTKNLFPNVDIDGRVMYGELVDCLQEYSESKKPWLVVLGNNQEEPTVIGGHTLRVLRHMQCAVIAVSQGVVYRPVKNICLACDYKKVSDKFPVAQVLDIVAKTGATLHVLNVSGDREMQEEIAAETGILHDYLSEAHPQYHFLRNENTDSAIVSFIETQQMDWLMLIPHKYSFFEAIFHKSHTKTMTQLTSIPLVALHEHE